MNSSPRLDPLELLKQQEATRLAWLVPERHRRMAENPFAFFRGAAIVMAADLGRHPHSGLMVQLCGDAHLLNFGFYGSPELQLLFDINDFDETHPGPFEWDLIRLATSLVLAARSLGLSEKEQSRVCRRGVRAYAKAMASFAAMPFIPMCVSKPPFEELIDQRAGANLQAHLNQVVADAVRRNSRQAVRKLCEVNSSGDLTFRHKPPLIWRYAELPSDVLFGVPWRQRFDLVYAEYLKSVRPELSHLLSQFRMSDCAFKAVGVGSVGTRCSIGVLVGDHPDDVLVLQSKQAEPSVLAPYIDQPSPEHQGQRVVQGQRLMQTASDPFLGWTTTPEGKPFYWRQFRNWKGAVDVTQLDTDGLKDYGKLCAWTLAKAHARSGDRRAIAAHIDEPKRYAQGILEQAMHHADLAEADHQSFLVSLNQSPGDHGARAPCCCHSPTESPGCWRRNSGSD
jgi:uncharacterized protein (DUF2252 family)